MVSHAGLSTVRGGGALCIYLTPTLFITRWLGLVRAQPAFFYCSGLVGTLFGHDLLVLRLERSYSGGGILKCA